MNRRLQHLLGVALVSSMALFKVWAAASKPDHPAAAARSAVGAAGFVVTLFAAEPDVVQPVGLTFDDRGRLWVVEMLTYAELTTNFDLTQHDRIVILEDTNGDGRADLRKVFWNRGQRVTSVAVGFGGVWVLAAPELLFIPDRDGDDVPDGPPEVLLDGWDAGPVRHNIVNGLKWGPDGWLYGRHGIQATSNVGPPGSSGADRIRLNCCIWRFHPTRREFEVVCHGGTNSWGHDWDQYGNLWFINTVIGHLWHGIPGAYYRRMYGEHLVPRRYELIDQHADHYHWNTSRPWMDSRDAGHGADLLGGGHAHSGLLIYQGDQWPAEYRHDLFTINFHGRRLNRERLVPQGSGYVGKHQPDFLQFSDPWFRGVDLALGPDGGVFILDWSDTGECHENDADGVHRDTGRVFRVTYGEPAPLAVPDLVRLSDLELVGLLRHANVWYARQAARILQERAAAGKDLALAHVALKRQLGTSPETPLRLRALWALHTSGGAPETLLLEHLTHADPYVRSWAITLLTESRPVGDAVAARLVELAATEASPRVRLVLASVLQRLGLEQRTELARKLILFEEDASDHNLPLLIWYGIEPALSADRPEARSLYIPCRIPQVRRLIARRLGEDLERKPADVDALLTWASQHPDPQARRDVLEGLTAALRGWRNPPMPSAWDVFVKRAVADSDEAMTDQLLAMGVMFRDTAAFVALAQRAGDTSIDPQTRQGALRRLLETDFPERITLLHQGLQDPVLRGIAARGLAESTRSDDLEAVLSQFDQLSAEDQATVVNQLISRPISTRLFLDAMRSGAVPRRALNSLQVRQILRHEAPDLTRGLSEVWGEIRDSDAEQHRLLARYRELLTAERLQRADFSRGRELFGAICASCHRLHGEGNLIGPDLTGSGRMDLEYLLENIVNPNGMVAADYRTSEIELRDGRLLTGVVLARRERTLEIQTQTELLVVDRSEIETVTESRFSLMPEGLLEPFGDDEIRDLIGYLMAP